MNLNSAASSYLEHSDSVFAHSPPSRHRRQECIELGAAYCYSATVGEGDRPARGVDRGDVHRTLTAPRRGLRYWPAGRTEIP
jgi:hypothetical protein